MTYNTLVVCAHGFDRALFAHVEFDNPLLIDEDSDAYQGHLVDTLVFAGFSDDHPPSDELMAKFLPCAANGSFTIMFTEDGENFRVVEE